MSGKGNNVNALEKALVEFTKLVISLSESTDKKIDKLTESVRLLIDASIKAEERHSQYDSRFARTESALEHQNGKIDMLSDSHIVMSKDIETNASWRSTVNKTIISLCVLIAAGVILWMMNIPK